MPLHPSENLDVTSTPAVSRRDLLTNALKATTLLALSGCMKPAAMQEPDVKEGESEGFYDDWIRVYTKHAEEHQRLLVERNRLVELGDISQTERERFNLEAAAYNENRTERNVHWGKHLETTDGKQSEPLPEIELL